MALSGSIGAPVFGILFGFGMSLVKRLITQMVDGKENGSSTPFPLFQFDENHKNTFVLLSGISYSIVNILLHNILFNMAIYIYMSRCYNYFNYEFAARSLETSVVH